MNLGDLKQECGRFLIDPETGEKVWLPMNVHIRTWVPDGINHVKALEAEQTKAMMYRSSELQSLANVMRGETLSEEVLHGDRVFVLEVL